MTREEAILTLQSHRKYITQSNPMLNKHYIVIAIDMAIEALQREEAEEKGYCHRIKPKEYLSADAEWIPCSERLPSEEDCPMDCMVTRRSKFIGNYVDMAVAEKNGTWTHEDWKAISHGDVESGRKTGLINTRDDEIVAWMPLPEPYKGGDTE